MVVTCCCAQKILVGWQLPGCQPVVASLFRFSPSGVGGGTGGSSALPKVLILEHPGKIPENLGKNGAQRFQENT